MKYKLLNYAEGLQ